MNLNDLSFGPQTTQNIVSSYQNRVYIGPIYGPLSDQGRGGLPHGQEALSLEVSLSQSRGLTYHLSVTQFRDENDEAIGSGTPPRLALRVSVLKALGFFAHLEGRLFQGEDNKLVVTKCIATSNKCLTSSNKKPVETRK